MIITNSSMSWRKDISMTMYKVITLPLAENDIVDQTDYIALKLKAPETAINMVEDFERQ